MVLIIKYIMEFAGEPMKKKGLILIEDGSFTFDNRVKKQIDALCNDGWTMTVICPKYKEDPFYKQINKKLRVYFYPKPNALGTLGHIFEHFISLFFMTILTLWVFLVHRFSVIQGCNPTDITWIIAMPYKFFGIKYIFDQHDLCPELFISRSDKNYKSKLYKILLWLEKKSYKYADIVFATNNSYKNVAIKRGSKDPKQVIVVRNGPSLTQFVIKTNNTKNKNFLIGYIGNMNAQDGVDHILDVVYHIIFKKNITDINFVLIGGGSSQPGLVALSKKMGLEKWITFTGRIPDDDMLAWLNKCHICIQPDPKNALNNLSTMNKVLEYMALAKPIVAYDLKETIFSCEDAALYAKDNNIVEMADNILYLIANPEIRKTLGKLGRLRIENQLAWKYSIPHLLKAYNKVLNL